MDTEFAQVLEELEQLRARCAHFERKYGVTSRRLYELYQRGQAADDTPERRRDLALWVGSYKAFLAREEELAALERRNELLVTRL